MIDGINTGRFKVAGIKEMLKREILLFESKPLSSITWFPAVCRLSSIILHPVFGVQYIVSSISIKYTASSIRCPVSYIRIQHSVSSNPTFPY